MRRLVTLVTASLTMLVLSIAPALAGSSFTAGAEAEANTDGHALTLTITEPDNEEYGDTSRVTVVVPEEFSVDQANGCEQELTWQCSVEGRTVTFTRTALGSLGDATLGFNVTTPATNGTYAFSVTQADEAEAEEEPTTVRSAPAVTVVGGEDPPPPPEDDSSSDDDSPEQSSNNQTSPDDDSSDASGDADATSDDPEDSSDDGATTIGDDQQSPGGSDTSDPDSDGSTTPRRSTGTTLEITPGEPIGQDEALTEPDVADDPAIAPPSDDSDGQGADTGTATATSIQSDPPASQDGSDGLPWQQLVGAMLLVTGGAVVALRRWDVLGRLRSWRND